MDYNYFPNTNKINTVKESFNSVDGINTMVRNSEHTFAYDQNGNTTAEEQNMTDINNVGTSKAVQTKRHILWQEQNQLRALSDDNAATHFIYDGNGERVLKISEQWHNVFVNSELSANPHMEPGYTIYVNPYMTVTHDGRYTKHIFAGADRVLSKIGNPKDYGADPTQLGLGLPNGKRGTLEGLIQKNCSELGIEDITYESQKPSSPGQDLGLTDENDDYEKLQYYFTKDHLGSSTIISDFEGKPVQHIEYTAFGESFADWRTETYDTPYRFTGKEQDAETSLYYYGARYYDPRLGRFLSVDPLAEKYGAWSPYVYTMDNPLKYTDPTGMWIPEYDDEKRTINLKWEKGDSRKSLKDWGNGAFNQKQVNDLYKSMKGGKIDMKNTYIGKFVEGFSADQDEFNCFSEVINGLLGSKSKNYRDSDESDFRSFLKQKGYGEKSLNDKNLKEAQPFKSAFGYTMKDSDGDYYSDGRLDHVEINAGKDRSGTTWVLTKDGPNAKLQFQKGTKYGVLNQTPDKLYKK